MDIENIRRRKAKAGSKVNINIKISVEASKWLKEQHYSPTGIFLEALKDLGYEASDIDTETEQIEAIELDFSSPEGDFEQNLKLDAEEAAKRKDPHPQSYAAQE